MGTDLDLREDKETLEKLARLHLTPISYRQGLRRQRDIGAARYIECSARTLRNVKMVFDEVACVALKFHTICSICEKVIKDSSPEAIFCEGQCNTWLHKRCAGFSWYSIPSFKTAISTDKPFYCPRCTKFMSSPKCSKATTHHIPVIGKVRELYFLRNSYDTNFCSMHNQIESLTLLVCSVLSTQTHKERYGEYSSLKTLPRNGNDLVQV